MTNTPIQATAPATLPAVAYNGAREVLLNRPVALKGTFDPKRVLKVSLIAEDKYSLNVMTNLQTGEWQVNLDRGFQMAGSRWLRLRGADGTGRTVEDQIVYLTVSTNPLTVGQSLTLKVLQDTFFKTSSQDSTKLNDRQKVKLTAGQTFTVTRYGYMDGHLKVELTQEISPVGNFGYVYEDFVQLSKGAQIFKFEIEDVPTTPVSAQMLITTTTLLKAKPTDSANLPANQKTNVLQGQTFQITGYACIAGHFRVKLAQPIQGFGDVGYIFWQFAQLKRGDRLVPFEQDSLTVTALRSTIFKKRPIDSSGLQNQEKFNFPAGAFYGVSSYSLESGHIKVALTEELPGFGNTSFVYPDFIQMRRGGRPFNPYPPQVEINVPYFSQRDNPQFSWSTCNVTSIAMVFYYYGVRSKSGGQLEDELLQWCVDRYGEGCQTDNSILSILIKAYGFKTSFSTTRKWAQIKDELVNRRPVVLGGDFTASGHILTVIGYTPQGYLVNDPWGNALTGYDDTEGRKLLYPYDYIDRVAGPDGNVWAHLIAK
jgi:hypothetical protein